MRSTSPPPSRPRGQPALRWNSWNLLLLVPLLMLLTPLYNSDEPRLFGIPVFYWLQLLFIPLGVLCVFVVYRKTADAAHGGDRAVYPVVPHWGLITGWVVGMGWGLVMLYGIPNPASGRQHFGGSALAPESCRFSAGIPLPARRCRSTSDSLRSSPTSWSPRW